MRFCLFVAEKDIVDGSDIGSSNHAVTINVTMNWSCAVSTTFFKNIQEFKPWISELIILHCACWDIKFAMKLVYAVKDVTTVRDTFWIFNF